MSKVWNSVVTAKNPPAPVVGNTKTTAGPKTNAKTTSESAKSPKDSKPNGDLAKDLEKNGQKHGTKTLAERAQVMYPSAAKPVSKPVAQRKK